MMLPLLLLPVVDLLSEVMYAEVRCEGGTGYPSGCSCRLDLEFARSPLEWYELFERLSGRGCLLAVETDEGGVG